MALNFEKGFNKFARVGTSINQGINKAIGKEVFKGIKEIEAPREFQPYDSFPEYSIPEPEQWSPLTGQAHQFSLSGNIISVSANLDVCMQYRESFKTTARYYADRFIFKYKNCVEDFDTFVNYFSDIYLEGLIPMAHRAYSLLLPFGVINADIDKFSSRHIDTYKRALTSYETLSGIEIRKNEAADNMGNKVGNSMKMQSFGLGVKGAIKGAAKAETFNLGMGVLGKYVASQKKMTQEEKANVFAKFKQDVFFEEVYSDYYNTFLTLVQFLSENGKLGNVTTYVNTDFNNMVRNLNNPMFPQEQVAPTLANLISTHPFNRTLFEILKVRFGETDEVKQIIDYFVV
jgi:hypothetical protein